MPFNYNAGYGKMIASALAARGLHTGNVLIVSATGLANWERLTAMFPVGPEGKTRVYSTLQGALNTVTDQGDDVIFIVPGHTETITAAAGIATGTAARGVRIIGLGDGNQRPTFSYSTVAAASFTVASAGVTFENIRFDFTGINALTGPLSLSAASPTFRRCEFITGSTANNAVVGIVTTNSVDYLDIDDCIFTGAATAGTTSAIRIVGGRWGRIRNSKFDGRYKISAGAIQVTTTAAGFLSIDNCIIRNTAPASVSAIDVVGGTSVVVAGCTLGILSGSAPISINEGLNSNGGGKSGSVLTARNYYRNASTIAAGTLL